MSLDPGEGLLRGKKAAGHWGILSSNRIRGELPQASETPTCLSEAQGASGNKTKSSNGHGHLSWSVACCGVTGS